MGRSPRFQASHYAIRADITGSGGGRLLYYLWETKFESRWRLFKNTVFNVVMDYPGMRFMPTTSCEFCNRNHLSMFLQFNSQSKRVCLTTAAGTLVGFFYFASTVDGTPIPLSETGS